MKVKALGATGRGRRVISRPS